MDAWLDNAASQLATAAVGYGQYKDHVRDVKATFRISFQYYFRYQNQEDLYCSVWLKGIDERFRKRFIESFSTHLLQALKKTSLSRVSLQSKKHFRRRMIAYFNENRVPDSERPDAIRASADDDVLKSPLAEGEVNDVAEWLFEHSLTHELTTSCRELEQDVAHRFQEIRKIAFLAGQKFGSLLMARTLAQDAVPEVAKTMWDALVQGAFTEDFCALPEEGRHSVEALRRDFVDGALFVLPVSISQLLESTGGDVKLLDLALLRPDREVFPIEVLIEEQRSDPHFVELMESRKEGIALEIARKRGGNVVPKAIRVGEEELHQRWSTRGAVEGLARHYFYFDTLAALGAKCGKDCKISRIHGSEK